METANNISIAERFTPILQSGDRKNMKEFLDDQNISDVAELIEEFHEEEAGK